MKYFFEASNVADYTQFLCHTVYFFLKNADYKNVKNPSFDHESSEQLEQTSLILVSIIFVAIVSKIMHQIKIYEDYGRLAELIT
jgi:hypothetical protein